MENPRPVHAIPSVEYAKAFPPFPPATHNVGGSVRTDPVAVLDPVADAGIPPPFTGYTTNVYVVFDASPVYTVLMLLAVLMSVPEAGEPATPPE